MLSMMVGGRLPGCLHVLLAWVLRGGIYRWLTQKCLLQMGSCLATGDSAVNIADKILASRELALVGHSVGQSTQSHAPHSRLETDPVDRGKLQSQTALFQNHTCLLINCKPLK